MNGAMSETIAGECPDSYRGNKANETSITMFLICFVRKESNDWLSVKVMEQGRYFRS
jgi:hypothetical protein